MRVTQTQGLLVVDFTGDADPTAGDESEQRYHAARERRLAAIEADHARDPLCWHGLRARLCPTCTAVLGRELPAVFDCGCSVHKVTLGLCDVYGPEGTLRQPEGRCR
jgi:hypothetical protein